MQKKLSLQLLSTIPAVFFALILSGSIAAQQKSAAGTVAAGSDPTPMAPPKTATDDIKDIVQGVEIVDHYRWLEDQDAPATRAWIKAENAYTDSIISKLPGRAELAKKVGALVKIDAVGIPFARGDRYFYGRRASDQDQFVLCMRQGLEGKEEVLIDPLPMSPDHTITVGLLNATRDGKILAYYVRQGGADEVQPHLYDVDARKDLPDTFPKGRYSGFAVLPDKSGIYLTKLLPEGPRVLFHKMGTDTSSDTEIFGKGYAPDKIMGNSVTDDGRYLLITISYGSAAERSEIYLKDLLKQGPIVPIVTDLKAAVFPEIEDGRMFVQTNWKAPKWRIMEVDMAHPAPENWREVIPQSDAVINSFSLIGGMIAVEMNQKVVGRIKLYDLHGKMVREITPPTLGSIGGPWGEWKSKQAFFTFTSFHMPPTIYSYNLADGKQAVWFKQNVPLDPDKYEVKQVWFTSKDGTKVPMFVAHAKGLRLDGSNPTLLTGYGGFNSSMTPGFSGFAAAWISSGGVYAVPNMRGGGEFGEDWHHAGMLEKKQNVFDDFFAAAEWLIANKYTQPSRLAIRGSSNGGLLMGAAITQRPELFGAVICGYPLLDMVRYQKFLVAKYWVPEYGSSDDPQQFKWLYAYSPYHHIKPGTKYPAVLFLTGDSDTRVAPLHARKMTALMQASGSDKPILLRYDTQAGHSGGTPASKQVQNTTDELNFLFWQLGAK